MYSLWQDLSHGSIIFNVVTLYLDLEIWPTFEKKLTLAITFSAERLKGFDIARVFLVTRKFIWYHNLWPWLWSLTYFWKTFTLAVYLYIVPPGERMERALLSSDNSYWADLLDIKNFALGLKCLRAFIIQYIEFGSSACLYGEQRWPSG